MGTAHGPFEEIGMENRISNYDVTRDRVEREFPQYDQETVIEKFHKSEAKRS